MPGTGSRGRFAKGGRAEFSRSMRRFDGIPTYVTSGGVLHKHICTYNCFTIRSHRFKCEIIGKFSYLFSEKNAILKC